MKVSVILGCCCGVAVLAGIAGTGRGTIIYQDTFPGSASAYLAGTKPGTDTTGSAWVLHGAVTSNSNPNWFANGGAPAQSFFGSDESLATSFSAGHIYTLSATMSPTAGTSSNSGNWFVLGFLDNTYYGNSTTVGPNIVITDEGGWQLYPGDVGVSPVASGSGITLGKTAEVVLNTTGAQWTAQWFYDGHSLGTYTYTTTPTFDGVGIGAYNNQQGTIGNFELQAVAVPEPTALALGCLAFFGGLLLLRRRKVL